MRPPRGAPRSALGGLPAPVPAEPGGRGPRGAARTGAGPGAPFPGCSRDDGRPSAAVGPARRSERELQLSRDFGRGLANLSEFLPRASPHPHPRPRAGRRARGAGPRPPAPAAASWPGGPSGRNPHRHAHPGFQCGGFGARGGGAAVRGRGQAAERRAPRRGAPGAGVARRGRRTLTFLGLTPNCGRREQQRGPSEGLACCALLLETSRGYGARDLVPPLSEMKLAYRVDCKP